MTKIGQQSFVQYAQPGMQARALGGPMGLYQQLMQFMQLFQLLQSFLNSGGLQPPVFGGGLGGNTTMAVPESGGSLGGSIGGNTTMAVPESGGSVGGGGGLGTTAIGAGEGGGDFTAGVGISTKALGEEGGLF